MTISITIDLPDLVATRLESVASRQHRSISEMMAEVMGTWSLNEFSAVPKLPDDVEAELATFTGLSDGILWILARSTLSTRQQEELSLLNHKAQQQPLSKLEQEHQQKLIDAYDRMMIRRAQAAMILKRRGYDLSNPEVLHVL